jgi:dephospho-CoA kinase
MNPRAIVVSDVPLLIEVSMQHLFDVVILVYIAPEDQISRLRERNEYSRKEAESRLDKQMPIDEKIPHADFVIDNKGPRETTRSVVSAVWDELLVRENKNLI